MWNWQRPDWPNFQYDSEAMQAIEQQFLLATRNPSVLQNISPKMTPKTWSCILCVMKPLTPLPLKGKCLIVIARHRSNAVGLFPKPTAPR